MVNVRTLGCALGLSLAAASATGCITTRAQHEALTARVAELEQRDADVEAQRASLAKAERELRAEIAALGVRFEEIEEVARETRGVSEEAGYLATSASREVVEMRSEVDGRLQVLEERLKEATGIPETKDELWAEAERLLAAGNHKQARRLWRMVEVRYPDEPRMSEVVFSIGLTHYGEGDYRSAITQFHRLAQNWGSESPFLVDSLYYAGLSFEKLGQCAHAIKYFEAILAEEVKASARYQTEAKNKIEALDRDEEGVCTDRQPPADTASPSTEDAP